MTKTLKTQGPNSVLMVIFGTALMFYLWVSHRQSSGSATVEYVDKKPKKSQKEMQGLVALLEEIQANTCNRDKKEMIMIRLT